MYRISNGMRIVKFSIEIALNQKGKLRVSRISRQVKKMTKSDMVRNLSSEAPVLSSNIGSFGLEQ